MSVTGIVHPDRVKTNAHIRAGDVLILTKPLGIGVYANALNAGKLSQSAYRDFVCVMERLNMYASRILQEFDVSAMTDVTGFGLLGHAFPMAEAAGQTIRFHFQQIPVLPDALELITRTGGQQIAGCEAYVKSALKKHPDIRPAHFGIAAEAQTSGGLLAAIRPEHAEKAVQALRENGDEYAAVIGETAALERTDEGKPAYLHLLP